MPTHNKSLNKLMIYLKMKRTIAFEGVFLLENNIPFEYEAHQTLYGICFEFNFK
jgi:hypothetical protein